MQSVEGPASFMRSSSTLERQRLQVNSGVQLARGASGERPLAVNPRHEGAPLTASAHTSLEQATEIIGNSPAADVATTASLGTHPSPRAATQAPGGLHLRRPWGPAPREALPSTEPPVATSRTTRPSARACAPVGGTCRACAR